MFYTREQMLNIVKSHINKSYVKKNKKKLYMARVAHEHIPIYHYSSSLMLNQRYFDTKLYWIKKFENYKNYRKFSKTYIRSKSKYVYKILSKYKHYIITFKSFYSNFYIMLTDNQGNPIVSCSTGQVSGSRSKKRKNSMMLIYPMIKKIKSVLLKRRIRHLAIHVKMDISNKIFTAIKFLTYSKLKYTITYIALLKPIPHHFGRRKKKPRRI